MRDPVTPSFIRRAEKSLRPVTPKSTMSVALKNVDAGVLAPFDYAALGHIHRAQHIGAEKYRYCGAPFPYSVSEAGEEKSVTVVELGEKGQPPVIRQIPLPPVREVKS